MGSRLSVFRVYRHLSFLAGVFFASLPTFLGLPAGDHRAVLRLQTRSCSDGHGGMDIWRTDLGLLGGME